LAQSANLHVGNNWNVLKLLIWRVSVVLAFVITPPAQARELVLAQGSQVDQYLAAVIVAIKAYDRLLGMRQLQALVLNPDTSPMMRQHTCWGASNRSGRPIPNFSGLRPWKTTIEILQRIPC